MNILCRYRIGILDKGTPT